MFACFNSEVTLKIFFEKPSTVFYPEEEIRCSFNVITNVPLKVQCIYVRVRGYGETKWSQRENKHTRIYHGEETYLNKVIYLWGNKDGTYTASVVPSSSTANVATSSSHASSTSFVVVPLGSKGTGGGDGRRIKSNLNSFARKLHSS